MDHCAVCGTLGTTKAHVKDKSVCLKEGIKNHKDYNIIHLCYNCHYILFDRRRMGIKVLNDIHYFIILQDDKKTIDVVRSRYQLNVLEEYIVWKNKKCYPKMWRTLLK